MIKGILIINNHGKPRVAKFYQSVVSKAVTTFNSEFSTPATLATQAFTSPLPLYLSQVGEEAQQRVIRRVFQQIVKRPDSFCNYLAGSVPEWGEDTKIIYRHYATLYFVFAVDGQESDLGILDLIQVIVEALDKCFENVCELDLIFHSDKVNYILDEIIMAGMVLETNIHAILAAVQDQAKLHAASLNSYDGSASLPPPSAGSGSGFLSNFGVK
ncbi:hypothetical protein EON64_04685 [archaeon]|nr:MAG: hypothetical protein EON64_04685 [archaeon]